MYITFKNGDEIFPKLEFFTNMLKHECLLCEDVMLTRDGECIIICMDDSVLFEMIRIITKIVVSEFLEADPGTSNFFNDESKNLIHELSERNIQFIECDLFTSFKHYKGYYRKEENFKIRVLSSFSCNVIKKFINEKLNLYTITKIISTINSTSTLIMMEKMLLL